MTTDIPTPGQVAYTAWWRTKYGMQQADPVSAYQMLPAADRRAWDAAAAAVRAATPRATPAAGRDEPQTPAPHGPVGPV